MRAHHLNCISTCPLGGRLVDGSGASIGRRARLACHCVLLETDAGLVLADTGFGVEDVRFAANRLSGFFMKLLRPELREEMTAVRQIRQLGFDPADVRHIVLTHLDFDHAGGLDDFPGARVHLLGRERTRAEAQRSWLDRQRYRPQQWSSAPRWQTYDGATGDAWFGFEAVRDLVGLPPEILLVPLPGHTDGHAGIAMHLDEGWLLLAGDAYFDHREMDPLAPHCAPGLALFQRLMEQDRSQRLANQQRLRELQRDHARRVTVTSSHDVVEFERLAGRPLSEPAHLLPPDEDDRSEPLRRRA